MYNAITVANAFIKLANNENRPITNMKLQKLVYIAEGYSLAMLDESLITNNIHAFQWGPVIPKLYESVKQYENRAINNFIDEPFNDEPISLNDKNNSEVAIIQGVWAQYGNLTAAQLSTITHKPNTPWSVTWEKKPYSVIPRNLIKEHYKEIIEKRPR